MHRAFALCSLIYLLGYFAMVASPRWALLSFAVFQLLGLSAMGFVWWRASRRSRPGR
jgi:hypothetical protein